MPLKVGEILKLLEADGSYLERPAVGRWIRERPAHPAPVHRGGDGHYPRRGLNAGLLLLGGCGGAAEALEQGHDGTGGRRGGVAVRGRQVLGLGGGGLRRGFG
jgi:hypothetical protein